MSDANRSVATRIINGPACLFLIWLFFSAFSSDDADGGKIHQEITREAFTGTLSDANIAYIIEAVESQGDKSDTEASQSRRHFAENQLVQSVRYMDRQKRKALNYAREADVDADARAHCLRHFGLMLHTAQDFYSSTNYIELELEDAEVFQNPFSMPLVDWSLVPDGYGGTRSGSPLSSEISTESGSTVNFAKDSAVSKTGKQKVGKTNLFNLAREMAVRETQRQWNLFEALIRRRCNERSKAIIAALRQASPSDVKRPGAE